MQNSEFTIFLKNLCAYYERKPVNPQAMDLWYDRVKLISADSLDTIRFQIVENSETFPKNLPNVMWEYYREWRQGKNKSSDTIKQDCEHCNGEGEIFLQKKHPSGEYYTRYVFRCDQCKQNKCSAYPWGNKVVLINHGYEPLPEMKGADSITNVKELQEFLGDLYELPF